MAFFTPRNVADNSFSQFENEPDFSVGVQGPQGGAIGGAQLVAIHMYVYNNGPVRKVVFSVPYGLPTITKGKAGDHLRRYTEALAKWDGQAREQ
jgi:hypothetical protein